MNWKITPLMVVLFCATSGASAPCYNGNIAEAVIQGNKYAYTYDNANRLTAAKYTDAGAGPRYVPNYSTTYAYDRNSNITALTRYGQTGINAWGKIDDLTMTYDGNQLSKVEDAAAEVLLENSHDIKVPVSTIQPSDSELPPFRYDSNGNTTRDHTRNIYSIRYNALNLPQSIVVSSSTAPLLPLMGNSSVEHAYDAAGIKHQTVHVSWTKIPTSFGRPLQIEKRDTTRYVGSRIYENGRLDRVLTPYGYIKDGVHHTFLHDYQGNVAAVVAGDSLVQRTSYYPYGLPHANAHGATANPYKYSGKEYDTFGGTDLYDFHARHHAPSAGRFMTVDQLCEEKPHLSGYTYCAGNPINHIDPTGMDEIKMNQLGEIVEQIETKDFDSISIVDDNGDMITGANFDLGTIERVSTTPINSTKSFDTYQIRGDQNSEIFFEKVSSATNVEWGEVKTGESGNRGKNYITTSHQDAQNDALTYLFNGQLLSGYTIREVNHNHPQNNPRPSGLNIGENDNDGDIQFAQKLCKILGYEPSFSIYLKNTDSYIKFTPRSTSKDFQ